jgi:hypothetical protein
MRSERDHHRRRECRRNRRLTDVGPLNASGFEVISADQSTDPNTAGGFDPPFPLRRLEDGPRVRSGPASSQRSRAARTLHRRGALLRGPRREGQWMIPRPVEFDYIWCDALAELDRTGVYERIINLETSVTPARTTGATRRSTTDLLLCACSTAYLRRSRRNTTLERSAIRESNRNSLRKVWTIQKYHINYIYNCYYG